MTAPRAADGFSPSAVRKGAVFTFLFALLTLWMAVHGAPRTQELPADIALQVLVLLNTFPSIRIFATIQDPRDRRQQAVDVILTALYLWMTLSLGQPLLYPLAGTLMFCAAAAKYALLLGRVPHLRLLRHKIVVDLSGILAWLLAFVGSVLFDPVASHCALLLLFALAQLSVFILHPLYVFRRET